MSFLFFSFFAVSSSFGVQPVQPSPGVIVECPAPSVPPEA